jgi:hypothetical protein
MATVSVRYIVDDVDAAIEFYCRELGFHEDMHPAPSFAMLSHGDLRLVLSWIAPISVEISWAACWDSSDTRGVPHHRPRRRPGPRVARRRSWRRTGVARRVLASPRRVEPFPARGRRHRGDRRASARTRCPVPQRDRHRRWRQTNPRRRSGGQSDRALPADNRRGKALNDTGGPPNGRGRRPDIGSVLEPKRPGHRAKRGGRRVGQEALPDPEAGSVARAIGIVAAKPIAGSDVRRP